MRLISHIILKGEPRASSSGNHERCTHSTVRPGAGGGPWYTQGSVVPAYTGRCIPTMVHPVRTPGRTIPTMMPGYTPGRTIPTRVYTRHVPHTHQDIYPACPSYHRVYSRHTPHTHGSWEARTGINLL